MTTNQRSREAAYADLVSGLIDARVDVASDRFDAELEAAESSGRLDPATARLLRWWQRESVRAVTEHARTTVPSTLVALEKAEKEAREAVYRADAAWTSARSVTTRSTYANEPAAPAPAQPSVESVPEPVAPAPAAAPEAEQPAPPVAEPPAPAPAPWSSTVTPAAPAPEAPTPTPWGTTLEPPNYPGEPVAPSAAPTGDEPPPTPPTPPTTGVAGRTYPTTPGEAPSIVDLTAHEAAQDPSATPGSGRRRTLLAGLTVLPRTD